MNKKFADHILLTFTENKQLRVLYQLARLIEEKSLENDSNEFELLGHYHSVLKDSSHQYISKINKEFKKIKTLDHTFQNYLMYLERFQGHSLKEYDFLVRTVDQSNTPKKSFPMTCLLDSIRSAHNVGSMFRNAECFGVEKLILCGLTPTPEHHQVVKTAMGCEDLILWEYQKGPLDSIKSFQNKGGIVYAIETGSKAEDINNITLTDFPILLLFGNEQFGLSLELLEAADHIVKIPLYGSKNSLNVGVSQAIALNSFTRLLNK